MNEELRKILNESDRYSDFTILELPIEFCKLFTDENFDAVQLHSTHVFEYDNDVKDIVGFCGAFSWINNELKSHDGDSYSENVKVLGYELFDYEDEFTGDAKKGIEILVGNDW